MARIPRNAPPLYNLQFMTHLFWDGRVSLVNNTLRTPAGDQLTKEMRDVFEFGAISALALFPITSREEMRGFAGNDLAVVADGDFTGIWRAVMTRLGKIPAYRQMFEAAYPGRTFDTMSAAHMSNAIAGFLVARMTFNNSRWDRFLRGENAALSTLELEGANNFLQARCTLCHSGTLLSDNGFHNVALAQFGPGQGDGPSGRDDFGRARVAGATCSTVDPGTGRRVSTSCRYAFRTPPLRNVDLSGPFGHAGQFASLTDFIDHYSESESKLRNYDPSQLPSDLRGTLLANFDDIMATRDPILSGVVFPGFAKASITQFMTAFTDDAAKSTASSMIPSSVPSGLPVSN
jgi:cytochrome c peroxidase